MNSFIGFMFMPVLFYSLATFNIEDEIFKKYTHTHVPTYKLEIEVCFDHFIFSTVKQYSHYSL